MVDVERLKQDIDNATCLFDRSAIDRGLDAMAQKMNQDLADVQPLVLSVVVGGLVVTGHLLTRLTMPLDLNYIHATRYLGATTGEEIQWVAFPTASIQGRHVVVVDDVLDGGITLQAIVEHCQRSGAAHVDTCVLVDKVGCRVDGGLPSATYTALEAGNEFLVGFGMDHEHYFRNLNGIYGLEVPEASDA